MKNTLLYSWSIIGCPLIYFILYQWMFSYSLNKGKMPFDVFTSIGEIGLIIVVLASGILSIVKIFSFSRKSVVFGTLYGLIMGVGLVAIGIWVNCINGNCL